jgi:tetratricopeptide (TPR) repeat protein
MGARMSQSPADRRFIILMAFQCLTLVLIALLIFSSRMSPEGREQAHLARDTAARLQAAGLNTEAINHYEQYLHEPGIEKSTRAEISFSVGQMYESEGRPEKALAWYYQVEGSDPNSQQAKEAAKKIVALLESLGRHQAAKAVLSSTTSLEKGKGESTGKTVAQIGDKKILLGELDEAMDALPPPVKGSFVGSEGKQKFLKKYVAEELLYEKAKRLQYDSDPKWLKQLEEIKRQFLVGRVLNEEILNKITVDEKDLRNYFEANKAKYAENKKIPSFDKLKQTVERDYRLEKGQTKYEALIEQLVNADNIKLFMENVK